MYKVEVKRKFSSAHFLRNYHGNCENLHGHNWGVYAVCRKEILEEDGMVIDFRKLKKSLDKILDEFDHKNLNDVPPFNKLEPTSENIAKVIYDRLQAKILPVKLDSIKVSETENSFAVYHE